MPNQRQDQWDRLQDNGNFDVVIVGGGINGIGVFRELALAGLKVLLIERNDFCSGCSAAPSRMIHGGLRYLENGEFDLVRESLQERDALLRNAPHLVHPLPTVIPIKSRFSGLMNSAASFFGLKGKPASRGAVPIKIGLTLYDWVTRKNRMMPTHAFYSKKETTHRWPHLMPDLKCSATYYDAWISHPERLGLELLLDAENANSNCIAMNYAEISPDGSDFVVRCVRSEWKVAVKAPILVNATGAWLDDTISDLNGPVRPNRLVSGTKGSHLILDNPALEKALAGHMAYFENGDGRVCIVFPFMGKVLAGSTDIRVEEVKRERCSIEERDYILESLQLVFPDLSIGAEDIVFSFFRHSPLPKSDHDFTGRISRGHYIKRLEGPFVQFCMIGGKWTTFRAFANQTADLVLKELGLDRTLDTKNTPIGGGAHCPPDLSDLAVALTKEFGVERDHATRLARTYGTKSGEILTFCQSLEDHALLEGTDDLALGELLYLLRHEHVETISDLVLRRTTLAIRGQLSLAALEQIIALFASERAINSAHQQRLRDDILTELNDYFGVTKHMLESRNSKRELTNAR